MRIALFITCITDTLSPIAGRATVEILEGLGHEVFFPEQQTCCGQMHLNSGFADHAGQLADRLAAVFDDPKFDAVVCPSASCTGMAREHCAGISGRVFELTEFLVGQLGLEDLGASYPHRVTYHPTCHSLRGLRLDEAPMRLLRAVRGIDLVELPEATICCGFGGTFAVKNADTSVAMLTDKVRAILDTGAEVCTAVDSSCLLQIGGALSRQRTGVRTVHLAEILASRG